MRNMRLIARLDIKQNWLIKGVQMEGWRKVGDPVPFACQYAAQGADELVFMDVVASLYMRNTLRGIVEAVANEVAIPMTVGGGIKSLADVGDLLACGADKVAINTAATQRPEILSDVADSYGSQATVLSIEAMPRADGRWQAMTDNGRNQTGRDVVEWAREGERLGAGEILVTAIHCDGLGRGYDIALLKAVTEAVSIPVIACGGLGTIAHLHTLATGTEASAAASASALHWGKLTLAQLRQAQAEAGFYVRPLAA